MIKPQPIHAEHCRCSRCEPLRRQEPHSGTLTVVAVGASASVIVVLVLLSCITPHVRELMLTIVNF